MIPTQEKFINADEFWQLLQQPENRERKLELIEGVVREVAGGTGGEHGEVTHQLGRLVGNFVADHKLGRMTAAETCYVLFRNPNGKDTVLCPDAGFVTMERAPQPLPSGYVPFAPDLAIEVKSPTDSKRDMRNKAEDYLRYGTKMVWLVFPAAQQVEVYYGKEFLEVDIDGVLDGKDVLPGFTLAVKDIFPQG